MKTFNKKETDVFAAKIRLGIAEEIKARGFGHVGGSLSIADVLAVLYENVMNYDPADPKKPDRDKLVCSKGHAGPAVYATLALKGFFPYQDLYTLNRPGTKLPSHCDRNKTPGIDMTTGSLGQGASLAAGMALGDKLKGRDNRVFLICGDGEINEGQVWEAAMFCVAKKIDNIVWFIDWNKKQLDGNTELIMPSLDIAAKFKAFGFDAVTVDGHDTQAIYDALQVRTEGKPKVIVLDTVKGKGISEVENTYANHSMTINAETGDRWIAELKAALAELEA